MRYTDKEVTIIVKDGLVQEVYGTDKDIKVRLINLDETDPQMLEQLEDEANCIRAEWYDIWKENVTMNRIDKIKNYAKNKALKQQTAEEEKLLKCKELTEEIKTLKPRIQELIEVGNACLVNGIALTGQAWGCHEGYETHQFITNCWSHLVGFVQNGKSAIFELGINAGGACGEWDFRTDGNKVYDIHEETKEHRKASLGHLQKFINKFDEFETTFYEYVDGITSKQ